MRLLILFIQILCIAIITESCNANKHDYDIIETKTDLTSVEIINFLPNNSNSISSGFTKQSTYIIDYETYSKINEKFNYADKNNIELYFDSSAYELIKKAGKLNYLNHRQITSLINRNIKESSLPKSHIYDVEISLIGVSYNLDNDLLITLEVPSDKSLNWSIVKIWSYDTVHSRPQIHSVLIAEFNCFDYINQIENNLYLSDGDFVYRVVLDNEYRFRKNMGIFVSMDFHEFIQ